MASTSKGRHESLKPGREAHDQANDGWKSNHGEMGAAAPAEGDGGRRKEEENAPGLAGASQARGAAGARRSPAPAGAMTLASPSFAHGETIPTNHTADGADLAPALVFGGVPRAAKSLALVVEDPDAPDPIAPQRTFTHWIVYDLSPSVGGLPLAADKAGLPPGARQGRNDFGRRGYAGPKPPVGRHRYIFRLFALDTTLRALDDPERGELFAAMRGHILAEAELMGTYEAERAGAHAQSLV